MSDFSVRKNKNVLRLNELRVYKKDGIDFWQSSFDNYYRATDVFGDIATKKKDFPQQIQIPSKINDLTMKTEYVEDVIANVSGMFADKTARDAKMQDIFAKQVGLWTKNGEQISGGFKFSQTDAYKFALSVNNDDFTMRETEYKGKKETNAYFDSDKSDLLVTLFSKEKINNKEYMTMRDKDGQIHYFDMSDNLKEIKM